MYWPILKVKFGGEYPTYGKDITTTGYQVRRACIECKFPVLHLLILPEPLQMLATRRQRHTPTVTACKLPSANSQIKGERMYGSNLKRRDFLANDFGS